MGWSRRRLREELGLILMNVHDPGEKTGVEASTEA
jgi:hypothetical protein